MEQRKEQLLDRGELLWEALWFTAQDPRGDRQALWAPHWKSSMASGAEFRASSLCVRQLQLCSSGRGWVSVPSQWVTDWPITEGSSIATWKQILSQRSLNLQVSDLQHKQPLRAGEVDVMASCTPRIDWSQDLHKQSAVGSSWCVWFSGLTPALVSLELGMNLLHSRGGEVTPGESPARAACGVTRISCGQALAEVVLVNGSSAAARILLLEGAGSVKPAR